MSHPCTCDEDACRCVQLLVLIFDAQLTVKPYKPTAPLMDGQQSSEHHMHRLLIQPTNRHLESRHFCRVLFLKSYWPVYDAVEIALNPAALIKKNFESRVNVSKNQRKFQTCGHGQKIDFAHTLPV